MRYFSVFFKGIILFATALPLAAQTADFDISHEGTTICAGDTVFLNCYASEYDYLHWFFGDGSDTYAANPAHIYTEAGNYELMLVAARQTGSADTARQNIEVHALPQLLLNIASDTVFVSDSYLTVRAEGNFDVLQWDNGSQAIEVTYTASGSYWAEARYSDTGCAVKDFFHLLFSGSGPGGEGIYLNTNVLTPNQDGINDQFIIENADDFCPCELLIYSWDGSMVYNQKNYDNSWSGTDNAGNVLPTGTYYYFIKSAGRLLKKGFIDVIKPL